MQISSKDKSFYIKGKKLSFNLNYSSIKYGIDLKIEFPKRSFTINAPGEYEVGGLSVMAFKSFYRGEFEDIKFIYLSNLNAVLSEKQIEGINDADVLFLFLYQSDFKVEQIAKTIKEIQPKMLIINGKENRDNLFSEIDYENPRKEIKLNLNKLNLSEDMDMEVVILKEKNG